MIATVIRRRWIGKIFARKLIYAGDAIAMG
jgi:hypothetical protein